MGYNGLQGVTSGDRRLEELQGIGRDDREFQKTTGDQMGFEGFTKAYRGLQWVTVDNK